MNRFREFMNWVFAPDASLLSSRQGSMTEQGRTPTSALTPLFASDFNFSIIPESVRSVTRHLLTKQFAHIWTPRADSDEKLDKPPDFEAMVRGFESSGPRMSVDAPG